MHNILRWVDSQGSCLEGSTKEEVQDSNEAAMLYNKPGRQTIRVLVEVDGVPLSMEVD